MFRRAHFAFLLALVAGTPQAELEVHTGIPDHPFEDVETHVINGKPSQIDCFPYIGMVGDADGPFCGGSLISSKYVLTAGHCVPDNSSEIMKVTFGTAFTFEFGQNEGNVVTKNVANVISHPNADLAILELEFDIQFNGKIKPINLPKSYQRFPNVFAWRKAVLSGWGIYEPGGKESSIVLRHARLNIVPSRICEILSMGMLEISRTELCTILTNGSGGCFGDSGGPLVLESWREKPTLVGVVVGGAGDCSSISIYTYVGSYLDWIGRNTGIPIRR